MRSSGPREDARNFYFMRPRMISSAPLCLYRFCSLLSTDYESLAAKVCWFSTLLGRGFSQSWPLPFLFQNHGFSFSAERKGAFCAPGQNIAALGIYCLVGNLCPPAHWAIGKALLWGGHVVWQALGEALPPHWGLAPAPLCLAATALLPGAGVSIEVRQDLGGEEGSTQVLRKQRATDRGKLGAQRSVLWWHLGRELAPWLGQDALSLCAFTSPSGKWSAGGPWRSFLPLKAWV